MTKKDYDLLIFTGEASGDLHGAKLIESLLQINPLLSICGICGPNMRKFPIDSLFKTEEFEVMGFTDVLLSLPSLYKKFFSVRDAILSANPKICLFIDYPGFSLRMEKSLRKKGYKGKLIHFICPSVWAWHKSRINTMSKNLDLLLTIFPFEKKCFSHTPLPVEYIGNPLLEYVKEYKHQNNFRKKKKLELDTKIVSLFPGSRKQEIERNLPLQLKVLKKLYDKNKFKLFISIRHNNFKQLISYHVQNHFTSNEVEFIDSRENYDLMKESYLSIATSGTITLELALHKTPTIVTYAIKTIDRIIAQKILKIDLPHYCIVNIIENKRIFPELFGPNFTEKNLYYWTEHLFTDQKAREDCIKNCEKLFLSLDKKNPSQTAAKNVLTLLD